MALMLAACAKPGTAGAPPNAATTATVQAQAEKCDDKGSRHAHHGRRAKSNGSDAGQRRQHAQKTPEQVIERLDTNKDGMLQKAEVPERMQKWFEHVDQNHDGVVTKDEIVTARAAHTAKHAKK